MRPQHLLQLPMTLCLLLVNMSIPVTADPMTMASKLFVTSYDGTITTLEFSLFSQKDPKEKTLGDGTETIQRSSDNQASLKVVQTTTECGISPSWLLLHNENLYCLDEAIDKQRGRVTAFNVDQQANLTRLGSHDIVAGAVSGVIYLGKDGKNSERGVLHLAHYAFSTVTSIRNPDVFNTTSNVSNFKTPLDTAGIDPKRQDTSHPHQAIIDPKHSFLLVPDLGTDLILIYRILKDGELKMMPSLVTPPGAGPRHAVFWSSSIPEHSSQMYLLVVAELSGDLLTYKVEYIDVGDGIEAMTFTLINSQSVLGRPTNGQKNAPAEIAVTPDNDYIVVSSRFDQSSSYIYEDTNGNRTVIKNSDTLTIFKPGYDQSGKFTLPLIQWQAAGGSNPRHFAINKAGNLVAVPLQSDNKLVIISRNIETGLFGDILAMESVGSKPTMVLWYE